MLTCSPALKTILRPAQHLFKAVAVGEEWFTELLGSLCLYYTLDIDQGAAASPFGSVCHNNCHSMTLKFRTPYEDSYQSFKTSLLLCLCKQPV